VRQDSSLEGGLGDGEDGGMALRFGHFDRGLLEGGQYG
jgi:hypothetical protein